MCVCVCVRACVCVCVCVCGCAYNYVNMNPFCPACVTLSVQVAPKVSTSHYTMAVIMYMRVSEEGGKGGEGKKQSGVWVVCLCVCVCVY